MAMIGNEDLATELWWRTALEMIDNKDHYNTPENTQAFQHLTSSYDESIYDYLSLIIPIFIHSKHWLLSFKERLFPFSTPSMAFKTLHT